MSVNKINVVWVWCLVQTLQKVSISYKHSFVLFLFQLISSPLKAPSKLGNKKIYIPILYRKKKYQSDIKIHSHSLKYKTSKWSKLFVSV